MAQDGSKRHFAQSPTVAALKYDAGVGPEPQKVMMERSFSQDIQEGTQELKDAAEQTRNIILDLGLDGTIRWVSPSWTDVVGTQLENVKGKPISLYIEGDKEVFDRAIIALKSNDSKSQYVKFGLMTSENGALGPMLDAQSSQSEKSDTGDEPPPSDERVLLELEGQGIMVWDRATGSESHTMWMLQPAAEPVHIEVELPRVLVEMLGVGAELLANYLSELTEAGANDPANHPPPLPIVCRICERSIVPWWFERHSDLCVQEHKSEMDVQMVQEGLTEHRHLIVKVLDALDARQGRSGLNESVAQALSPEYKGLPIGPSPATSALSSLAGSQNPSPVRSRSPSATGLGHARMRSSFIVRRPAARAVELILDLCDTAIEISVPAIKDVKSDDDDFRTQSPLSESRIGQIIRWQPPSTIESEPGLAALSADTEKLARAKVEAVHRHQFILEYSERIRQEYLAEVDACIIEALAKAQRIADGELSSSDEDELDMDMGSPTNEQQQALDDESTSLSFAPEEPEIVRAESRPQLRSMASALRNQFENPLSYLEARRSSSQAVSTGSSSPQECPTPKSTKGNVLQQPQPLHKRRSMYVGPDEGELSDSSMPSISSTAYLRRMDSPTPSGELSLSRSASSRDRKRRSMHLHGLNSASPHRGQSPSHLPPAPSSPLRTTKGRLPSVDTSSQSPIVSPLLTSGEFPASPQYHHHSQHRRQSSIHSSDARAPLSPRLSSTAHPQPRVQPPSIKDFEVVKPISKGAFGSVYLSKKKLTGEYFAIKVLRKADMVAKNQVTNVKAERAIMMWQGESDFVAKLYWTFSSKDYLFLVMEYLNGGDCASLVKILGGLSEDWAKKYIAEVVLGVEHLHSRGIVHRDLKPDNLLIDSKGHLKLTDFGLSRMGLIGRQKRALKSPEEPDPELFKQGNFSSQALGPASRSASFDYHTGPSPGHTPLMTPALAGGLDQPSYFSLNREGSLSRDFSRRASGYRSDSGSVSSHDLLSSFAGLGLSDSHEGGRPLSVHYRHNPIEEESLSQASASPDLMPLSMSTSNISQPPVTASQMLPPPTALFDPEESGKRFVGTPDYLAPETIRGTTQDEMCDWWSLGCILFEFLYGVPPFNAPTTEQVFDNILSRRIAWPEDEEAEISDEAKDLVNKLIQLDPKERLGANMDEKHHSGGAEIQAHPWFADINWETLLEDEAQFVPNPENPEDTEYFDARGATLQSFPEELEDAISPPLSTSGGNEYPDRPHDALFRARSQISSAKRGLMPLHIPPHIARDSRSRRLSEPVIADDFGNFTFKNLPVLEKANKDIVEKMRKETMQAQVRSMQSLHSASSSMSQPASTIPTPSVTSPSPSVEGSPMLPMPVQRALSVNKHQHRPGSPSGLGSSPSRGSQPSSPMMQYSQIHHERRKTSGSSTSSNLQNAAVYDPASARLPPATASPVKRLSSISPAKPIASLTPGTPGRNRSHTVGSQDSDLQMREPFVPGHHKRRSQLITRDQSPSSSDNETAHAKAILKVQRKRQSSRRLSQFNILEGPAYRPLDILICEDHPVSKMVMEKLFEKLRCRTITATSGPQAMAYAVGQIQFDIIFTEYKLPLANGVDLARMIKDTKSANTHTPIVCITGYLKDLPDEHQFDSLLQKPPTLTKLTEALCKYCMWKPPPKDYKPTLPLVFPTHRPQDSPSSVSSKAPTMAGSSAGGTNLTYDDGSVSSIGFFSDRDSVKTDDQISVVISRAGTDDWSRGGLGISGDGPAETSHFQTTIPRLLKTESAPAHVPEEPETHDFAEDHQASNDAIREKRASIEKVRTNIGGDEEGDDEDEELGRLHPRQKSPRPMRTGSKLGHEMLRTNSRGSVISINDERAAEANSLRRSLELLEGRMDEMRIVEESNAILGSVQPRKNMRNSSDHSHPEPERPQSRGHITPPELFPLAPGKTTLEFEIDDQATPMPNKTIDFGDQPTPKARSENGSTIHQQDI